MTRRGLVLSFFLCGTFTLHAQRTNKLGLALSGYVREHAGLGEEVDLFVHGNKAGIAGRVLELGGLVKMSVKDVVSVRMPVDAITTLAQDPSVTSFEFSLEEGVALNDSSRVKTRIDKVQAGLAPLPQAYDGQGVLIGIIDTGVDYHHPDLKDSLGHTRILKYWDHFLSYDAVLTPAAYGYGREYTAAMIDAGQCPSTDHNFGHGTTVAGAAASNGLATGNYKGGAPQSDLIVVASKLTLPNWRATIADAVKYIIDEADALGRPVAINISLGSYMGSHDGQDATALLIDSMLTAERGRVLVSAAGNSGEFADYHLRTDVDSDTSFTWFQWEISNQYGFSGLYMDTWADTADFSNVRFAIGADRVTPSYAFRGRTPFHDVSEALGTQVTDSLWSLNGNLLGLVDFIATPRGGQVHLEVAIAYPDTTTYLYRFMTTGSGHFDVWSMQSTSSDMVTTLPTPLAFPPIVNYVLPDDREQIVDSWACSPNVLTVGNYYNETTYLDANNNITNVGGTENDIVAASSPGPTRDGRVKPDLAAPGEITLSCGPLTTMAAFLSGGQGYKLANDSLHMRNGGTSMASPAACGAVALFLQKCPYAYPVDVIAAFNNTCYTDAFTGAVPNDFWGHGKIDAFAALSATNFPAPVITPLGPTTFCPEDSVGVQSDSGALFWWSDGDTTNPGYANAAGPYSLMMASAQGCPAWSDTIVFDTYPAAITPLINLSGASLESTPASTYQWLLEGAPVSGANSQTYDFAVNGNYQVLITDGNGCSAVSDTLLILNVGIDAPSAGNSAMSCWPSPVSDQLFVALPASTSSSPFTYTICDGRGQVVRAGTLKAGSQAMVDMSGVAAGVYSLNVLQGGARQVAVFVVK